MAGPPSEPLDALETAADLPQLLLLLASTREQAEQWRSESLQATERAERALAEAGSLRSEIDGMVATLVTRDEEIESIRSLQAAAEGRAVDLEHELALQRQHAEASDRMISHLEETGASLAESEWQARAELEQVRRSTSWRVTKPLRWVSDMLAHRKRFP